MNRQQMPQQMPSMPTGLGSLAMSDNEPRMQDRSPEEQIFSIESEIKNLMKEYEMAVRNGENQRAQMIADQVGKLDEMKIKIQETTRPRQIDNIKSILNAGTLGMTPGKDMGGRPVNMDADTVRQNQMEMGDLSRFGMAGGGEALNSMVQQTQQIMNNLGMDVAQDTKIIKNAFGLSDPMMAANILQKTFKNKYPNLKEDDINNLINYGHEAFSREASKNFSNGGEALKQIPEGNKGLPNLPEDVRNIMGYFQDGGEAIDSELAGMQMSEEDAMEVNDMDSNDMQMIEQLMMVVQQLISQGVGEQEIRMFLKEQGLDDEDIETLFEMLGDSAMQQQQDQGIDQQLQGMM